MFCDWKKITIIIYGKKSFDDIRYIRRRNLLMEPAAHKNERKKNDDLC